MRDSRAKFRNCTRVRACSFDSNTASAAHAGHQRDTRTATPTPLRRRGASRRGCQSTTNRRILLNSPAVQNVVETGIRMRHVSYTRELPRCGGTTKHTPWANQHVILPQRELPGRHPVARAWRIAARPQILAIARTPKDACHDLVHAHPATPRCSGIGQIWARSTLISDGNLGGSSALQGVRACGLPPERAGASHRSCAAEPLPDVVHSGCGGVATTADLSHTRGGIVARAPRAVTHECVVCRRNQWRAWCTDELVHASDLGRTWVLSSPSSAIWEVSHRSARHRADVLDGINTEWSSSQLRHSSSKR